MGKLNIRNSFKDKKFKYGGYATLMTAIVIAVILFVNLVVGQLDIKFDLTKNNLFSISKESKDIINSLKSEVQITGLYQTGDSSGYTLQVKEILGKYDDLSKNIKVDYIDPVKHPEFAKGFKNSEEIATGNIVVKSGDKYKVILQSDLYAVQYDDYGQSKITGSQAEQKITAAIRYVTSEKSATVYVLQGHEEEALPTGLNTTIEDENYTVKDLNLLKDEWNPELGDVLLINAPARDISKEEFDKIKEYVDKKAGRIVFFSKWVEADTKNINELLNYYGINLDKAMILEGDSSYAVQQANLLVPDYQTQQIVNPLKDAQRPVIIPNAQPISESKIKKGTVKFEPLLKTSSKAYAKISTEGQTAAQEAGDLSGPFNVAAAVTDELDSTNTDKNGKIVVYGTSASLILDPNIIQYSNGSNEDLFLNSLNWLSDKKESITIRPKDLTSETLQITQAQILIVAGIAVIVIPVIVAAIGISVWLRRRHL